MKKLVFDSLNELFENKKNKETEKVDNPKPRNSAKEKAKIEKTKAVKITQNKKEKAMQAIAALKKEIQEVKKPGTFKLASDKNVKIKELNDKIKTWEDKLKNIK